MSQVNLKMKWENLVVSHYYDIPPNIVQRMCAWSTWGFLRTELLFCWCTCTIVEIPKPCLWREILPEYLQLTICLYRARYTAYWRGY